MLKIVCLCVCCNKDFKKNKQKKKEECENKGILDLKGTKFLVRKIANSET